MSWTSGTSAALLAGLVLGVASRLGHALPDVWWQVASLGGPWLLVAFGVGALAASGLLAVFLGAISMVAAMAGYYGWIELVQGGAGQSRLWAVAGVWLAVGVVSGAGFGAAGWVWRFGGLPKRVGAIALLVAALVGEAVYLLPQGDTVALPLLAELVAGFSLPWLLLRRRDSSMVAAALGLAGIPVAAVVTAVILALARTVV